MIRPDFDEFVRLAARGDLVPISREFLFDADTAVTAYSKLADPRFGFLLESVVGGEHWARYTFVGTSPREVWRLERDNLISTWGPDTGWSEPVEVTDPLADLDRRIQARRPVDLPWLPRFWGGAVGYLGYDVVRSIEGLADPLPDDRGLPDGLFLFTDLVLAIDNLYGRAHAIAAVDLSGVSTEAELRHLYDAAVEEVGRVVELLGERPGPSPLTLHELESDPEFTSSYTRSTFERDVRRIQDAIEAGEVEQAVLSQRLTVPLKARPFDLYRALRSLNPSPYLFFLELDGIALVGSSPEVLVRLEGDQVTLRPIGGTRPRGRDPVEDDALIRDLLADTKELAEHEILVQLGREDLARVTRPGTIVMTDSEVIERYSHVLHLVSQLSGELRDGLSAIDVFRATFPAGTVSGSPRRRAIELIDELEPVRRGPYAGAVGYLAYGGKTMDMAIAIRTLIAADERAYLQAGAGIVAESDPAAEYEETLAKARALLRILGVVPGREGEGVEPPAEAGARVEVTDPA